MVQPISFKDEEIEAQEKLWIFVNSEIRVIYSHKPK